MRSRFEERLQREIRHLIHGATSEDKPLGAGTVRFTGRCSGDAEVVIGKSKAVLGALDDALLRGLGADDDWRGLLPEWFSAACAPEMSLAEAETELESWRARSEEEQQMLVSSERWPLSNWVFWLSEENRQWYWWDAVATDRNSLIIAVEVDGWPFASGALSWLVRAAGAVDFSSEA